MPTNLFSKQVTLHQSNRATMIIMHLNASGTKINLGITFSIIKGFQHLKIERSMLSKEKVKTGFTIS